MKAMPQVAALVAIAAVELAARDAPLAADLARMLFDWFA